MKLACFDNALEHCAPLLVTATRRGGGGVKACLPVVSYYEVFLQAPGNANAQSVEGWDQ